VHLLPAFNVLLSLVNRNLGSEHHFQKHGIRFMCVCPSYVLTRIIEAPYLDPDIAPLIQQVVQEAKDKNLCIKPETLAADLVGFLDIKQDRLRPVSRFPLIRCSLLT
jgi:NAD(P)-dependent dehydrogenase (short-subunit alcohol dehydrogenase family)